MLVNLGTWFRIAGRWTVALCLLPSIGYTSPPRAEPFELDLRGLNAFSIEGQNSSLVTLLPGARVDGGWLPHGKEGPNAGVALTGRGASVGIALIRLPFRGLRFDSIDGKTNFLVASRFRNCFSCGKTEKWTTALFPSARHGSITLEPGTYLLHLWSLAGNGNVRLELKGLTGSQHLSLDTEKSGLVHVPLNDAASSEDALAWQGEARFSAPDKFLMLSSLDASVDQSQVLARGDCLVFDSLLPSEILNGPQCRVPSELKMGEYSYEASLVDSSDAPIQLVWNILRAIRSTGKAADYGMWMRSDGNFLRSNAQAIVIPIPN